MDPLEDVRLDIESAAAESDYVAVNTLWLALLKLANLEDGPQELARMVALVDRISGVNKGDGSHSLLSVSARGSFFGRPRGRMVCSRPS